MRIAQICLAGAALLAACSKPPAAANQAANAAPASAPVSATAPASASAPAGAAVTGLYTGNGKAATLTQVTAHKGDPFDGQPVTELVFTAQDQGGDPDASMNAVFNKFGDALVVRVEPDGTVIGADVVHSGLKSPGGSISISGMLTMKDYKAAGGQISGHLVTDGPQDVFDQKLQIDLTFHTKAP